MNARLQETINVISKIKISEERKEVLQPLIDYIALKTNENTAVRLNFICTHNSRRSHLSQIWAQVMAFNFGFKNITTYSGGTEATALFYKVVEIIEQQGFEVQKLSETNNPIYAIKFEANEMPVIGFSKIFDNDFNPKANFAAIMTCSSADEGCPFIAGAEGRFPIRYNDPKQFDETDLMGEKYLERSEEIASEMFYVFSKIKNGA